ncbi:TniQ family protein [Synechocystis sp. PCC 7509]|uniref:TniQ family protein n=1 Tax=Synechocystis sp. PCC 7509 TaxID=927677 RepID=UPI0003159D75|nr:TniQ family protein [Synechocystis sp. PCC 7509]
MSCNKKLLRRPRPYPMESLAGYIIRLTENNHYPSVNWIFQMSGLKKRGMYANVFSPTIDNLSQLCLLSETEEDVLWSMAFPCVTQTCFPTFNTIQVFGNVVSPYALKKNYVKLCPICLNESAYYRQIWNLSIFTSCPFHQCLLIDRCPQCQRGISWSGASVVKCKCQFDWRSIQPKSIESEQLNLSIHVYKLCQSPSNCLSNNQNLLANNLVERLDLKHLITLLDALARFCQIPAIKQSLFVQDSCQLSPDNSDIYFNYIWGLFKNWPDFFFNSLRNMKFI